MPRREATARVLGVGVALLSGLFAWRAIGWPAPGLSVGLGLAAYWLAREKRG